MANISSLNVYSEEVLQENDLFVPISEEDLVGIQNKTNIEQYFEIHVIITVSFEFVCCFIAMSACIFLIVTICKFHKLRSTRTNIYILNIFVLFVIHMPMVLLTFHGDFSSILIVQLFITLLILYMFFGFLLGLDWLIISIKPHWSEFSKKCQIWVIGTIYAMAFIEWLFSLWYVKKHHLVRMQIHFIIYIFVLIATIILNIIKQFSQHCYDSSNNSYIFTCSNIIVFSILPLLIHHFLYFALEYAFVVLLISFIPELFFIIHPVIIVYLLGRNDKQFRMAYYKSFRLLRHGYDGDELDDSENSDLKVNNQQVIYKKLDDQFDLMEEVNLY